MRRIALVVVAVILLAAAAWAAWRLAGRATLAEPLVLAATGGVEPAVVALIEERLAAVRAAPGDHAARLALAHAYHANGHHALAAACYEQALAMDDGDARTWFHLGRARAETGDLEGAIAAVRRSITLDRDAAHAHRHLASWLLDQGRVEAAAPAVEAAAIRAPGAPGVAFERARLLLQQGAPADAAAILARLLREVGPLHRDTVANALATAYRAAGRPDDAARVAPADATLRARWPDPWTAEVNRDRLLRVWVGWEADEAMRAGRPADVLPKLRRVQAAGDDDPALLDKLARVLYTTGRRADALELLESGVRRHPDSAALRVNLAIACAEAGRFDDAVGHLEAALRVAPGNGSLHHQRGRLLLELGRHEEAEAALRKAIELGRSDAMLYTHLGETLCRLERWAEAVPCLATALAREPRIAAAHLWTARAKAELGQVGEAAAALEGARRLGASGPEVQATARLIERAGRGGRR